MLTNLSALLLPVVALLQAPQGDAPATYRDDRYDFSIAVPGPWAKAKLADYAVPGTARAAWSGPEGASIVAFVQEPGQAYTPRFLVDESAKAIVQAIKAEVSEQEVKTVAGKQAMSLILSAPGTGGALGAGGDVETVQHWVAIPREKDIVVVLLTAPSSRYEELKPTFAEAIESLAVGGEQTAEQKASK